MKCSDNEPSSKSKPQRKITKQEWSKHGPLKILEVGSGGNWTSEHENYAIHDLSVNCFSYRKN